MFSSKILSALMVAVILFHYGYAKNIPKSRKTREADLSTVIRILQEQRDRLEAEDFRRLAESGLDLDSLGLLDDEEDEEADDSTPYWFPDSEPETVVKEISVEKDVPNTNGDNEIVEATNEEIENIFNNSEPDQKIIKTEVVTEEKVPPEQTDGDENSNNGEDLSEEEYQALIRAVQKLQKNSKNDKPEIDVEIMKKKRAPKEVVKVSKEELNDVFGNAQPEDKRQKADVLKRSPQNKIEETLPLEDYWLLNNYVNYDEDTRRKRFSSPQRESAIQEVNKPAMLDKEKVKMAATIEKLQLVNHLEDLENEALLEALNEATHSQPEGTVSRKEYSSLNKAIQIEETLQAMDLSDEQLAVLVQKIAEASLKRSEPPMKKKSTKRMDTENLDEEYPTAKRGTKRAPYQDEQGIWYDYPTKDRSEEIPPKELLEYIESQIADNQEENEKERVDDENETLVPEYLLDDKPQDSTDEMYMNENKEDECPEIDTYSDGCAFADYYGLPIDKEARELCNRYQICYTCGASFGLTSQWCDNTYRQIYSNLCDDNSECVIEAELFLRTMKLKRRFIKQQLCVDQCTADYIGIP